VVINKFYCHMASQSIFTDPDMPVLWMLKHMFWRHIGDMIKS
jgi:hypothetical protein